MPRNSTLLRECKVLIVAALTTSATAQNSGWFTRSDRNKEEQPHWITPLATTTPRLEQEFRYDIVWQELGGGRNVWSIGNSKGLELIPFDCTELIVAYLRICLAIFLRHPTASVISPGW